MRFKIAVSILGCCAEGGIRTHEAEAVELKSTPFDRSGTLAILVFPNVTFNDGYYAGLSQVSVNSILCPHDFDRTITFIKL